MKIAELIARLEQFSPNLEVSIKGGPGCYAGLMVGSFTNGEATVIMEDD
jgi:hypothetical protein